MKLSLSCFNLLLLMKRGKLFARCCTVERWQTNDLWFRDEKTLRVSERGGKSFTENADRTGRSNSWNKNEDFIAKAQRLYKLQSSTSASGERKGNEREKRERNVEALRESRSRRSTGSDRSFREIFMRDSTKMDLKFECNLRIFPLLNSRKI